MSSKVIRLSKTLSWLLRHAAEKEGLIVDHDGYVFVEDVLRHPKFKSYTVVDIHECVEDNNKKRFGLIIDPSTGKEKIRAHQGHSMEAAASIDMREITDPNEFPIVVHGTYLQHWQSIRESGLSRMSRLHIHFAPGFLNQTNVISGMRKTANLYIYIDMHKALQDGLKFFISSNNVILSPGNEHGLILPRYFRSVQKADGEKLYASTD